MPDSEPYHHHHHIIDFGPVARLQRHRLLLRLPCVSAMNIQLRDLPYSATPWDVKRAFAAILHQPPFYDSEAHKARRVYVGFDI